MFAKVLAPSEQLDSRPHEASPNATSSDFKLEFLFRPNLRIPHCYHCRGLNNWYRVLGAPYFNYSIIIHPQNPILITTASILNPHNTPYSNPYRPLNGNPIQIIKAPMLSNCVGKCLPRPSKLVSPDGKLAPPRPESSEPQEIQGP